MISTLLSFAAVAACTIAAAVPVIQNCTMPHPLPPDLFAYCNKSVDDTELKRSLQMLYIESDNMIDLLETVCNKTVSNHNILL